MFGIKVTIEEFIDGSQPGWVECRLVDASGTHHLFVEKVPVVSVDDLDAEHGVSARGHRGLYSYRRALRERWP